VLGNIENMQRAFAPEPVQIEVVCFGKGLELLLKTDTAYQEHLKKVVDSGVSVVACQNSMRKRNVTTADLLPFAGQVDSGAAEVVRKQEAGWSYLKSGE
jgi:intracellular sulfur oxidation DsrE/DsrF family protein